MDAAVLQTLFEIFYSVAFEFKALEDSKCWVSVIWLCRQDYGLLNEITLFRKWERMQIWLAPDCWWRLFCCFVAHQRDSLVVELFRKFCRCWSSCLKCEQTVCVRLLGDTTDYILRENVSGFYSIQEHFPQSSVVVVLLLTELLWFGS